MINPFADRQSPVSENLWIEVTSAPNTFLGVEQHRKNHHPTPKLTKVLNRVSHFKVEPLGREGETPVWILGGGENTREFFFSGGPIQLLFFSHEDSWMESFPLKQKVAECYWVPANLNLRLRRYSIR